MRDEMSIKFRMCLSKLFALVVALIFAGQIASAQTSSFTYQGKLADSGVAANGTYDITFKLYDTLANAHGHGIRRAQVTLTDSNGTTRTAITGTFGYYRFDDVEVGQTYVVSVRSSRFGFASDTQVLSVNDEISDLTFTALPE